MSDAEFVLAVFRDLEALDSACLDLVFAEAAQPRDVQLVSKVFCQVQACQRKLVAHDLLRLDQLAIRVLQSNPGDWGIRFYEDVMGPIGAPVADLHHQVHRRHSQLLVLARLLAGAQRSTTAAGSDGAKAEQTETPGLLTIWHHGDKSYSIDGKTPVNVTNEQHNVLRAFLDKTVALDTQALNNTGANNVTAVINKIATKFGDGAVRRPQQKGDGYFIRVRSLNATN